MTITAQPIAGALGAEVRGVDLTQPLDDASFASVHQLWMEHQVLFFRDQPVTPEAHKAFGQRLGTLQVHPFLPSRKEEGHPEIVVLESDESKPFVAAGWHTDVTFIPTPPLASVLHAVEVPGWGGDTMWSSMTAAYEGLSDAMQRLLSELVAVHDTSSTFGRAGFAEYETFGKGDAGAKKGERAKKDDGADRKLRAEHPVIRTHPETGRKGIFVNSAFTQRIKGMKPKESFTLLRFLYDHVDSPEYVCRLHWEPHTIAMWDNRCTQHRVVADNLPAKRRMERVTIDGDAPY